MPRRRRRGGRSGGEDADRALVERAQRGEKSAFDLLVLKYQHRVVKLISQYVHDPAEVLDLAQEAFLKAYAALPNFRGDSAFYTWLYRIAVNAAKNHLASEGRRRAGADLDPEEAERYESPSELDERATPERLALKDEIERTVAAAIEELPIELRTAITLRELEGMSYEEIAAVMDCPVGTVRSRIFRAREAINRRLEPLLK